jgi:hypothetical protein
MGRGVSDHEPPEPVRMIGGELPTWSDLGSAREPARRGVQIPILSPVLRSRSRVLLAGPHEPDLIVALADAVAGRLTCLVRSIPDAQMLAETLGPAGIRVVCGSLERYDETGYDAVVALDGIGRLYSTEGPEATYAAALADLRRLSTPSGVLAVMVDNELGLHGLTAPVQPEADHSESAFARPPGADDSLPGNLADLIALSGTGAAIWPVYPLPGAPAVAWGPAAGSVDPSEYGGLFAALCAGPARTLAQRNPAADAGLLLRRIWRSGHLADLAPGWLVVTGVDGGADDVVAWTVASQGDAEVVRLAGTRPVLTDGSGVPAGQLLSDLLLQAAVAPDQAALRSTVRGYAGWLAHLSEPAPATAERVIVGADGSHHLLTVGSAAGPAAKTADEQLLVSITDLVREVESHGYRRTWPSYLTPAEAVSWVAAMRGEPLPADLVQQVAISAEPEPAAPVTAPVVQEVRARFEESNASRARWFETRLRSTEKQLSVAYRELDQARLRVAQAEAEKTRINARFKALQSSRTMRVMRAVRHPLRTGKRVARRVAKPVVKPILNRAGARRR